MPAETKAVNLATQAINLAVEETMLQANVLKMAEIITDDSGRIQAVKYDTAKISQTAAPLPRRFYKPCMIWIPKHSAFPGKVP